MSPFSLSVYLRLCVNLDFRVESFDPCTCRSAYVTLNSLVILETKPCKVLFLCDSSLVSRACKLSFLGSSLNKKVLVLKTNLLEQPRIGDKFCQKFEVKTKH